MECGGYCPICGKKMQNKNRNQLDTYMTVDHIIPKCVGGRKNFENLRPLCKACNNARKSKPIKDLLAYKTNNGLWITAGVKGDTKCDITM